jgi:hypothetical protein
VSKPDYRTLHEANALTDFLRGLASNTDDGFFSELGRNLSKKILTKKNPDDKYMGPNITGNIAKSAVSLTAVFPVIVTEATSVENAAMVAKAVERKAVGMLQMLFAANQISNVASVRDYMAGFHNNIAGSLDVSNMDVDDVIDSLDSFDPNPITEDAEYKALEAEGIKGVLEDYKQCMAYSLSYDINPTPISAFRVKNNVFGEAVVHRSHTTTPTGDEKVRIVSTTTTTDRNGNVRTEKNDTTTRTIRPERVDPSRESEIGNLWQATQAFNKQIIPTDVKKANEAIPSLMIVNFKTNMGHGQTALNTCVIGVKAMIHYVSSQDLITRVVMKNSDRRGLLNFIRATTGEIAFFNDFLFAVNRAKIDAVAKAGKGSTNPIWKLLELRANRLKAARASNKAEVGCAAISTIVISQAEVDVIKRLHRIDLNKAGTMLAIMRGYNLMASCIIDEVKERVDFLYDDGTKNYESFSFMSLEREDSGAMYKKVINLASKGR